MSRIGNRHSPPTSAGKRTTHPCRQAPFHHSSQPRPQGWATHRHVVRCDRASSAQACELSRPRLPPLTPRRRTRAARQQASRQANRRSHERNARRARRRSFPDRRAAQLLDPLLARQQIGRHPRRNRCSASRPAAPVGQQRLLRTELAVPRRKAHRNLRQAHRSHHHRIVRRSPIVLTESTKSFRL
jgi:hypothetical protein